MMWLYKTHQSNVCSFWLWLLIAAGQMNPVAFRWFAYRSRIIGVCEDILHRNWCSGKLLLGSHGYKPLWVDHCATTVRILSAAFVFVLDKQYSCALINYLIPFGKFSFYFRQKILFQTLFENTIPISFVCKAINASLNFSLDQANVLCALITVNKSNF